MSEVAIGPCTDARPHTWELVPVICDTCGDHDAYVCRRCGTHVDEFEAAERFKAIEEDGRG